MTYANLSSFTPGSNRQARNINDAAVGNESATIHYEFERSIQHFLDSLPYTRRWNNTIARFLTLKLQWEAETSFLSSITEISMHPAYQQIIGMGPAAIPLIFSEMMRQRGQWFWALKAITGEDPVFPEHRGNIKKMTEAWLQWGRMQGYIR